MGEYENVWRAFAENEISHSGAHYLLAVAACERLGDAPRAADIARQLGVSRAAVSLQLRALRDQGLVDVDPGHRLSLSTAGAALVARIAGKRQAVRIFLHRVLGVPEELAEMDACKIEHLLSEDSAAGLVRLLSFLRSGHPAAERFLQAFGEAVSHCPPTSRCDLCTETCFLNLVRPT